jgi:hypothetical protein
MAAVLLIGGASLVALAPIVPGASTLADAATAITYAAALSGPGESPPNDSLGTGFTRVDFDPSAHALRVQVAFMGLVAPTTASHIHACTAAPRSGTVGVATHVPFFQGFPIGVTSGTYDHTFDTLDLATYNPAFVAANGGTAADAEAVLASCLAAGRAYLNVHSTRFPGGEIRGFLLPAGTAKNECKGGASQSLPDPRTGQLFANQGQCVSFVESH